MIELYSMTLQSPQTDQEIPKAAALAEASPPLLGTGRSPGESSMKDADRFRSEKVEAVETRGLHLVVAWRCPAVKAECLRDCGVERPDEIQGRE